MTSIHRIFFIGFLSFFSFLFAQTPVDFSIQIEMLAPQKLDAIYLADVDLQNFNTAEDIFQITIRKTNPTLTKAINNCFLYVELTRDDKPILTANSDLFTIPGDFTEKTFTNRELSSGFDFGSGAITYFHGVNLTSYSNDLRNDILKSGKLPIGVYRILVELHIQSPQGPLIGQGEKILLKATNPDYLRLVSPGSPIGSGQSANIYTQYPIFQWVGNGSEYQLLVFEKKDMMQSVDDIVNGQAIWASERTNQISLQYPQSANAIPLEYGKTYYWMVRMFIETSAGEETRDSEVWEFSLANPEQAAGLQDQIVRENILQFLAEILGPRIKDVRASLEGYHLKRIRFNGKEITLNQLYEILNGYNGQSFKIIDFIPPESER